MAKENKKESINSKGTSLLGESQTLTRASGFAGISNAAIDYSLLNTKAMFEQTQAMSIEQQALERANLLREQFSEALGNADTLSARRGVKVGEGSSLINKEQSSKAFGEDIALSEKNAASKAKLLRTQSKINKSLGRASLLSGLTTSGIKIADSYN